MGRSNGCEANRKRADAQKRAEKYAKTGNSQLAANASSMSLQCAICFQQFMSTQKKAAVQHWEQKHKDGKDGKQFTECFPMCEDAEIPDKKK